MARIPDRLRGVFVHTHSSRAAPSHSRNYDKRKIQANKSACQEMKTCNNGEALVSISLVWVRRVKGNPEFEHDAA